MSTMNRKEYEAYHEECLRGAGMDGEQIAEMMDRLYPKSTEGVIHELQQRGLDATAWRVEAWARKPDVKLHIIGGARVWYRRDIDRFAAALEREGKLTPEAAFRKQHGLSYAQCKTMLDERLAKEAAQKAKEGE